MTTAAIAPTATPTTVAFNAVALDDLAHRLAERGIDSAEAEIARLANRLRCAGIGGVLLDVLSDRRQPEVARQRAFGRLHGLALATSGVTMVAA